MTIMDERVMKIVEDVPPEIMSNTLDIIAKALMLRQGMSVTISFEEAMQAAKTRAVVEILESGDVLFRVYEGN